MSTTHPFIRKFDDKQVKALQNSELFNKYLKPDCRQGEVFPAIRNNRLGFYYYGRRLFLFGRMAGKVGFVTNTKYAFDDVEGRGKEVTDDQAGIRTGTDYKMLKRRCKGHAQKEASGLSPLYKCGNLFKPKSELRLLDIEIAFAKHSKETLPETVLHEDKRKRTGTDRIDALFLYGNTLMFVEAKHFSNGGLRGNPPQVLHQITSYRKQIEERKRDILKAYQGYVDLLNNAFEMNIPSPKNVHPEVGLMVYGYNRGEQKSALSCRDRLRGLKIHCHAIGYVRNLRSNGQIVKLLQQTGYR